MSPNTDSLVIIHREVLFFFLHYALVRCYFDNIASKLFRKI